MPYNTKEKKYAYHKRWLKNHPGYMKKYVRSFLERNPDYQKEYRKNHLKKGYWNKYYKEHYLKRRLNGGEQAKHMVGKMVKKGILLSLRSVFIPCCDCGKRATQYDHRDYNFPKIVEPVCASCNVRRGPGIPLKKTILNEVANV